jgi:uncharacterized protein
MFAFRLLIFFLLAYIFIVIIYKLLLPSRIERLKRSQEHSDQGQELVLCSHCQSYVPKSEAVFSRGYYFCQEQCARLFVMRHNQEVSKADNNGSSR